jgi:hypothetical protein
MLTAASFRRAYPSTGVHIHGHQFHKGQRDQRHQQEGIQFPAPQSQDEQDGDVDQVKEQLQAQLQPGRRFFVLGGLS